MAVSSSTHADGWSIGGLPKVSPMSLLNARISFIMKKSDGRPGRKERLGRIIYVYANGLLKVHGVIRGVRTTKPYDWFIRADEISGIDEQSLFKGWDQVEA